MKTTQDHRSKAKDMIKNGLSTKAIRGGLIRNELLTKSQANSLVRNLRKKMRLYKPAPKHKTNFKIIKINEGWWRINLIEI